MKEQTEQTRVNGDKPIPTIFEEWERHARHLIPEHAGRMQRLTTRAAFVAGLSTVLYLTDMIAEKLDDEHGADAIAKLHADADTFSANLLADGIQYALDRASARG